MYFSKIIKQTTGSSDASLMTLYTSPEQNEIWGYLCTYSPFPNTPERVFEYWVLNDPNRVDFYGARFYLDDINPVSISINTWIDDLKQETTPRTYVFRDALSEPFPTNRADFNEFNGNIAFGIYTVAPNETQLTCITLEQPKTMINGDQFYNQMSLMTTQSSPIRLYQYSPKIDLNPPKNIIEIAKDGVNGQMKINLSDIEFIMKESVGTSHDLKIFEASLTQI